MIEPPALVIVVLCAVPLGILVVELVGHLLPGPRGGPRPSGDEQEPPQPTTVRCAGCGTEVPLASWRVERGRDGVPRLTCPVCGLPAAGRVDE